MSSASDTILMKIAAGLTPPEVLEALSPEQRRVLQEQFPPMPDMFVMLFNEVFRMYESEKAREAAFFPPSTPTVH